MEQIWYRDIMHKIISLNIEGHKHIDRFVPYIQKQKADIVCMQEVFESDMDTYRKAFGMEGIFAQMTEREKRPGVVDASGVALFTKGPLENVQQTYYVGDEHTLHSRVLLHGDFHNIHIGTTHFTWSPNGEADDLQRAHMQLFLQKLSKIPEIIFCGDLNAPRGKEIFAALEEKYIDHIPKQYITSLDQELHRAGPLSYMVDGLFSTPEYETKGVQLVCRVSDQCAIVGEVARTES